MSIEFDRADRLGERYRRRTAEVFVQGFDEDFSYFLRDPEVLADTFASMLLLERFHVARVDGEPAALASVTMGDQECFAPVRRSMQRSLGALHGLISHQIVRSQFLRGL